MPNIIFNSPTDAWTTNKLLLRYCRLPVAREQPEKLRERFQENIGTELQRLREEAVTSAGEDNLCGASCRWEAHENGND
ncbi:hypothetical protein E3N88_41316 [Mikania micrantha]|uniref:Uncharacterized protein n=1 Tax=Mikania micrantha TaxID=192012 RepID=A0A5N6LQ81_9ASTR|nr:hypothetical protein E3N88_41316 [Mikania micrantha]